jgi:hypothetical protein
MKGSALAPLLASILGGGECSYTLHVPATILPGKKPGTHWAAGCVGLRAVLCALEKIKILFSVLGFEL